MSRAQYLRGSTVAAIRALPRAKQAELYWRALAATARGDENELALLRHLLVGLQRGLPNGDPADMTMLPVDEFNARFGI